MPLLFAAVIPSMMTDPHCKPPTSKPNVAILCSSIPEIVMSRLVAPIPIVLPALTQLSMHVAVPVSTKLLEAKLISLAVITSNWPVVLNVLEESIDNVPVPV